MNINLIWKDYEGWIKKFEVEDEDKWGYPIYKKDADNNFIVKEIEEIEVPFLRKEVYAVTTWLKNNKHKLIK